MIEFYGKAFGAEEAHRARLEPGQMMLSTQTWIGDQAVPGR